MTERIDPASVSIDDFLTELAVEDPPAPHAARWEDGVPIYAAATVEGAEPRPLMAEMAQVFESGSGILVIEGAMDPAVLDEASAVFESIIADERDAGQGGGDHFAEPGANDRIWNVLEKHCLRAPDNFVDYYADHALALTAEAWLGPGYQVTAQVNVVNPGAEAQHPHRDYHLGFMTEAEAARFPPHAHRLSPVLTLQGAIAHCDMPTETGPTTYLPRSQRYELGYLAWRQPDFERYFAEHRVQLELAKGDLVFFNPALFHAAGSNRTESVRRMANLLQISSPLGRAMEDIDRHAMVAAVYPVLQQRLAAGVDRAAIDRVVAACAEGYAFPADLDREQPVDGLAPPADAALVRLALDEGWAPERLSEALAARMRPSGDASARR